MTNIVKLKSHLIFYDLPLFAREKRVWLMRLCGLVAPAMLIALNYVRYSSGTPLKWEISIPGTIVAVSCLVFVIIENRNSKKLPSLRIEVESSIVPAVYAIGLIAAALILVLRQASW